MGQYYFIPTSSINYNNILSSESISPPSFYEKRGYGFKRFEKVTPSPLNHSFLAYSKIPRFSLKNSEREEFPLFIAVPKAFLQSFKIVQKSNSEIIQIDGTVFLNEKSCFFIVGSEQDKMKLIASTQRSIEVKYSNNYNNSIYSLSEYDSFLWDDSCLNGLLDLKNINESNLKKDQQINKLKGLLYGFCSGKLMDQSDDLINGKRYFQDFVNVFSSLMNDLSFLSTNKSKASQAPKNLKSTFEKLIDLQEKIKDTIGRNEKIKINTAIIQDFGISEDFVKSLESITYKKTKTSIFSIIADFIKSKESHYLSIDDLLDQLVHRAINLTNFGSSEGYKKLGGDFDKVFNIAKDKITSLQLSEMSQNKLNILPFVATSEMEIEIKKNGFYKDEFNLFEVICNEFLSRLELSSSDEIGQLRKDFIESIGKRIVVISNQKDSEELVYLRDLYQSLKTVGIGFKPFHIENKALQSLACFMTRYAELGKLQDYMEKNGLRNFEYAYSYWGAAYGYANLSKLFIEPITSNPEIIKLINSFLTPLLGQGAYNEESNKPFLTGLDKPKSIPFSLPKKIGTKQSETKIFEIESDNNDQEAIKEEKQTFGEILKLKSSFGNNNEWISILLEFSKKAEVESKKDLGFYPVAQTLQEFSRILNGNSKSLNRFGSKKIEEAIKLFEEYLKNE